MTSPRTHALRFRIWAHCEPLGWDVTIAEVARAIEEPISAVVSAAQSAGWASRFRAAPKRAPMSGYTWNANHIAADVVAGRINMELTNA